jgi:prephenate dehydratase
VELLTNDVSDISESDYTELFGNFDSDVDISDVVDENKGYIKGMLDKVASFDRIKLAELLGKKMSGSLVLDNVEEPSGNSKVIYLKNSLADIAYSAFSKVIDNARVVYAESFSEACEEVYYSRIPYCILPIENSDDGRMVSFANLIRKYDLKIIMTCNVTSAGEKVTKFALLKRELSILPCPDKMRGGEYLEIELNLGSKGSLHNVLESASMFGFRFCKMDSLPLQYSENEYYFNIVFEGRGNIDGFICWLEFEVQRYDIIGIYTQLKL